MIPMPLPGWVKWAAAAVLAAALYGAGFVRGIDHAEDRHAGFVAGVAAAGERQAARTNIIIRDQQRLTEETRHGYAQALDALHAHYAGRLRSARAGGGAVPAAGGDPQGVARGSADPGPGTAGPAAEAGADGDLRERCAVTTLRFLYLRALVEGGESTWRANQPKE